LDFPCQSGNDGEFAKTEGHRRGRIQKHSEPITGINFASRKTSLQTGLNLEGRLSRVGLNFELQP